MGSIPTIFSQEILTRKSADRHGLSARLHNVRAEVLTPGSKGCGPQPRVLNEVFWFTGDLPIDGTVAEAGAYVESTPQAKIRLGLLTITGGAPPNRPAGANGVTTSKYVVGDSKGASQ